MNRIKNLVLRKLPLVTACLAFIVLALAPATSEAFVGLKIQPIKISETLKPGSSYGSSILLTNESDAEINVEINVQDFIPLAGSETIQFVSRTEGVTSVRDWINIKGPTRFSFGKGDSRRVDFSINAPSDAEPGGHFGVVFFKGTEIGGEGELRVGAQVGTLVLITIPGNRLQRGQVLDFFANYFNQQPPVGFTLKFENTGTVHFEPKGEIRITNMFGQESGVVPVSGQVVLPTGVKDLHFAWVPSFAIGWYQGEATIYDSLGEVIAKAKTAFWVVPIWHAAAFILTVVLLYLLFRSIRRRVNISITLKK